jgi:hypothetical protein
MKKFVAWIALFLPIFIFGCSHGPTAPSTYNVRYEVKAEAIASGACLTTTDRILFMDNGQSVLTTIYSPSLPWQYSTTVAYNFPAQLTVMDLQPESAVSDNTRLTLTIYKDNAMFVTQTFTGKQVGGSMNIERDIQ